MQVTDDDAIPSLTPTLLELEADFQRQVYLKARRDGTIVGAVRSYEQNGTRLLHTIEAHFTTAQRYELFTSERSTRNLYRYQKLGYHIYRSEPLTAEVTIIYLDRSNALRSVA